MDRVERYVNLGHLDPWQIQRDTMISFHCLRCTSLVDMRGELRLPTDDLDRKKTALQLLKEDELEIFRFTVDRNLS